MIHILTVHWQNPDWIGVQQAYLRRHVSRPFLTYSFLNGIDPEPYRSDFFYISTEPVAEHAIKLNLLADVATMNATGDDDLLVFIDSDAFPIADIAVFAEKNLRQYPLIAVRRDENLGDPQPHPCFCMTTVGFWRRIRGDWKRGYQWRNALGLAVTDVGGNLLGQLTKAAIDWLPLLRSNTTNLHPVFFAIYGGLVYHHGAGSRAAQSRTDIAAFSALPRPLQALARRTGIYRRMRARIEAKNGELGREMFNAIVADPQFYRRLQVG